MILTFGGKQIGQMDTNFFQHIKPLLNYWGLDWNENYHEIEPAMYGQCFVISGLEQRDLDRVKEFLKHTDVIIEENPSGMSTTASISVSFVADQPVPIIIQTENSKLLYITPAKNTENAVQNMIHKSILCKRKANHYSFSFRWREKEYIPEWISYLILQIGLSKTFSSLASLSIGEYQTGINHILRSINPMLADLQCEKETKKMKKPKMEPEFKVPDTFIAPQQHIPVRSRPATVTRNKNLHNGPAISPFKSVQTPESTINPFKQKNSKTSTAINPFQPNTYTTRRSKE
ncbi:hypothetical protein [Fictibacillus sp. KU28468]|uniref:hypothetical protein n=1 Tax=Fictibacillus sp. KU28468 TaxID=2991053 RepID=UPI00223D4E90|nr:hypothetical protein [Fictibacillus sp. KU28468]UZJ77348.1 hypothetical protein OKX00_14290 [Fictibacillus sp. KU28468]